MPDIKHTAFSGRLVIVGFGSIGQGVLPLLLRHIDLRPDQIVVITAELRGHEVAEEYGVRFVETALTRENYRAVLDPWLGDGDFLLNVSVDVSSVALIELCRDKGALYLDTCIEPWPGGYTDPNLPPSARSNYALRESALALRAMAITAKTRPDRSPDAWRQSRAGVAFRQAGAHRHRARRRPGDRGAGRPRRLGAARGAARGQGHPHRRARHAGRRRSRRSRASSSTPGRSTAFTARARSRPSWAGARMSGISRRTAGATISAARRRSTCCVRAPARGCAAGRRSKAPISAF